MVATVFGTRKLDFKTNDGNEINGTQIFVAYKQDGVDGHMTNKVFVPNNSPVRLPVFKFGQEYDFRYDGFGRNQRLVSIDLVNQ